MLEEIERESSQQKEAVCRADPGQSDICREHVFERWLLKAIATVGHFSIQIGSLNNMRSASQIWDQREASALDFALRGFIQNPFPLDGLERKDAGWKLGMDLPGSAFELQINAPGQVL